MRDIAVAQVASDTQITVIQDDSSNLFLIPYPNEDKEKCVPISMTEYYDFFYNLETLFKIQSLVDDNKYKITFNEQEPYIYLALESFSDFETVPTNLFMNGYEPLHNVVLEDNISDFEQHRKYIDQKFGLPKPLYSVLGTSYGKNYGFLIAIRNPKFRGSVGVPLAFLHPMIDSRLFIPVDRFTRLYDDKNDPFYNRTDTVYTIGTCSGFLVNENGETVNAKQTIKLKNDEVVNLKNLVKSNRTKFFPFPHMMYSKFIQCWKVKITTENEANLVALPHSSVSNSKKCTNSITDEFPIIQEMYLCKECGIDEGVCSQCKQSCHLYHQTVFIGIVTGHCKCSKVKKCSCLNVHEREPQDFQ